MRPDPALEAIEREEVRPPVETGSVLILPTYRRVASDGVVVTQCPPMPARGYGLIVVDIKW